HATTTPPVGRILIVEDDPEVLDVTVEMLRTLGWEVLTAPDAPSGLSVLRRDADIDVLFSDIVMPRGMNGVELAREARRLRPELRRQDQRAAIGVLLNQPGAAGARSLRIAAGHRRPFRLQALQRVMQHVADKDAALAARPGVDHDIARGMAGIALEPQAVIERVIVADEERLPRLDDRQDAVAKGARMRRVDAAVMDALPMVVFALRHDIARL